MKSIKKYLNISFVLSAIIFLCLASKTHSQNNVVNSPKLILQITVDQLRGDMPGSVYNQLGEGGFRYLYENGIVYENEMFCNYSTDYL